MGIPLLVILGVAAVASLVAVVVLWPRIPGPQSRRWIPRTGLVLLSQGLAVLLALALVNHYGAFYTTWGEIVGSTSSAAQIRHYGGDQKAGDMASRSADRPLLPAKANHTIPAKSGKTGRLVVRGFTNWSTKSQWATKGRVETVSIRGLESDLSVLGYVYLPPQYFQPQWAHHTFPAVEALSGYYGATQAEVTRFDYPGISRSLVQQHRSTPMIFVMIPSTVTPPRDTECTDVPHGPQVETFLSQEVPSAMQAAFRVRPADWGIVGDSTGGYCATKILLHHSGTFKAGISLSGYYYTLQDRTTGNLWGGSAQLRNLNDPEWLITHYLPPPVHLFITSGTGETFPDGYADTRRFLRDVRPPMKVTAMIVPGGMHSVATWRKELPTALHWMSHQLTHASPMPLP
ncbi:MAG TPA: alpha/beta hydrolase-fold protein [Segeticoccus sp.]|uniref:alpha/beta hydrolase n=1 Tax=Segeticoccus sp. TaxID=2706531 RepID=UPI002D7F125E|nr:alpha/beta hydrolase-fold protein [Segeticoccus sp.]HET8601059.1 alpha/beta hydrolase-fold protein [Segeticoccus sp.]